jgi:hypothetical protein
MLDLNNPGVDLLLFLVTGLFLARHRIVQALRRFREYSWTEESEFTAPDSAPEPKYLNNKTVSPIAIPKVASMLVDTTVFPGAAYALKSPPKGIDAALAYMRANEASNADKSGYYVPLGWYRGPKDGQAHLAYTTLNGGVNNALITGMPDTGKDNLLTNMVMCLAQQHTPEEVQIVCMDNKGLDWAFLEQSPYTALLCMDPTQVSSTMDWINEERLRRMRYLKERKLRKWKPGCGLPLLMIIITEISLLESAVGSTKAHQWLGANLNSYRGYGGRCFVNTQNVSRMPPAWRGAISLYIAAAQSKPSLDAPNALYSAEEFEVFGAIAPSKLPNPGNGGQGFFTLVSTGARDALTVRSSYIPDDMLETLSEKLLRRDASKPLTVVSDTAKLDDLVVDYDDDDGDDEGDEGGPEVIVAPLAVRRDEPRTPYSLTFAELAARITPGMTDEQAARHIFGTVDAGALRRIQVARKTGKEIAA